MTFSILGHCLETGQFGVAICSSSPAVAARCAHARARLGAVATQNVTDPSLGPFVLDAMAQGRDAAAAVRAAEALAGDTAPWRQVTALDAAGGAAFSGAHALGINGHAIGQRAVAAGNMLAADSVLAAMLGAFENSTGGLGARLVRALEAGLAAGGEAGPVHSAGLLVVADQPWPLADLRVDWSDAPVADLAALWALWEPQMHDYVTRALNPHAAPSYGVPGDP